MHYQHLVADNGFIMLNDCRHSTNGTKQNLGVFEALGSFTNRSDVILVRKKSMLVQPMDMTLTNPLPRNPLPTDHFSTRGLRKPAAQYQFSLKKPRAKQQRRHP